MEKELFAIEGSVLQEILDDESEFFEVIDKRYEFIGCDHDLWEFQAIIMRIQDKKFFKVNWFDNYGCNWDELGLLEEIYDVEEVIPVVETRIVYI